MTNTQKHLFIFGIIATFLFLVYNKSIASFIIKQLEISQACDNNKTACEMKGVEI